MDFSYHLILVTDCGGSDRGRYEIATRQCFQHKVPQITFFETHSMSTLHAGFTTAAHALSTIDYFGPLDEFSNVGILDNAAPRYGKALRGDNRNRDGEEIYALRLDNRVWVVGPNAGLNFYFLQPRIKESYLVIDKSGMSTPFRSMEIMIPALAKVVGHINVPNIELTPKKLVLEKPKSKLLVADWDEHGNLYIVPVGNKKNYFPDLGESRVFRIGNNIARLRHVDGIFAGNTGEPTLTTGSLKLNGQPVYYIVVVGSSARSLFGNPPVGAEVIIEEE